MRSKLVQEPPHLESDLRELRLPAMLEHWRRCTEEATAKGHSHAESLAELAHLELTSRSERKIARRVKDAHFPMLKTLDGFDFDAQPTLDRDELLGLMSCAFVERHENVILIGEVGTGKTHLASALGLAACQRGLRVRFITAAELCNTLLEAKSQDRLSRKLAQLARFDLVVLDELGYVPFDRVGADLLFGFIAQIYEQRSLIVTTNLPFARWTEVFLDPTAAAAVIDRIAHHAVIMETQGKSFRLREALERQASRGPKKRTKAT